jgi:adenylate cyclase
MQRTPPTAVSQSSPHPWGVNNGETITPSSAFNGTFFDDSSDNLSQLSPSFRPGTGRSGITESPEGTFYNREEDRRPSVASTNTNASSTGSKSSISKNTGYRKQLGNIFGEDYDSQDHTRSSRSKVYEHKHHGKRRHHSTHSRERRDPLDTSGNSHHLSRPGTPSRPQTPVPSSDVTPWLYQDMEDISHYGDAPVHNAPSGLDKERYDNGGGSDHASISSHSSHHSRLHLPHGHRHSRSKEDSKSVSAAQVNRDKDLPQRPIVPPYDSSSSIQRLKNYVPSAMSSTSTLGGRPSSPVNNNAFGGGVDGAPRSPSGSVKHTNKKSFFGKLIRKKSKEEHSRPTTARNLPSFSSGRPSAAAQARDLANSNLRADTPTARKGRDRDGSVTTLSDTLFHHHHGRKDTLDQGTPRKDSMAKTPGSSGKRVGGRRGHQSEGSGDAKGTPTTARETNGLSMFLDTDLTNLEGIVNQPSNTIHTQEDNGAGGIFLGYTPGEPKPNPFDQPAPGAAPGPGVSTGAGWNAPDSWQVNTTEDEIADMLGGGLDDKEGKLPQDEDDGRTHCVRVFRVDSTFATLSCTLNTTVSEVLNLLGRKSFLQDELSNYQIVLRKHDLQRILKPGERPFLIQKRLLEQAGYTEGDRLDEIGREDNSYLCQFSFLPTRSGGYSLEKDPGFRNIQKFTHVVLAGRNLITIPITLYQKSNEIISLDLSKNLSLDVPKDFIQGCINLREIKFMSNECWKLPPSLCLASRLTYLDISNNRLDMLEHANLGKLTSLVSLKMANNVVKHLPIYFRDFKSLRSLNISSNEIEEFPSFLSELHSLVDLDMSFNFVSSFPEEVGDLRALERLVATNNRLTGAFPAGFSKLANLREVDIRYNALSNIDVISQLPRLETLMIGHNSVSSFDGTFQRIRNLHLNSNPVTTFKISSEILTLTSLSLSNAQLVQLDDKLCMMMPNLEKLILDNNHVTKIPESVGNLRRLQHLSISHNMLNLVPNEIGQLSELRHLDLRENNLKKLPSEIWNCAKLETLNMSSNILSVFPKPGATAATPQRSMSPESSATLTSRTGSYEELGPLENFGNRRPSQASGGLLSVGTSIAGNRNGSIVSVYGPGGRKASIVSRSINTSGSDGSMSQPSPIQQTSRKDSAFSNRSLSTFAGTLRNLYLADNRLNDDIFDEITHLHELRILNLSYNDLYDIPNRTLARWPHLSELYLSGNELTSLPSDELEQVSLLKVLHLNGNKFQVLPAELGKVGKLLVLDVGSNALKYNVSNWPYDWNWNWNVNLKYLNLSGNKRLEIKPSFNTATSRGQGEKSLTDFNSLHNLRVLGLMDVTLTIPTVPDQTEDRRVRTTGSMAGASAYAMADTLGKNEHLSTIDMVVPNFRGNADEILLGMFDGQALSSGGSKVAKYLHENFGFLFTEELNKLKPDEKPTDALRRTFLSLNKDLAGAAMQTPDMKDNTSALSHRGSTAAAVLSPDDLKSGGVATVLFLQGQELHVSNVGDCQAMLIQSAGSHKILTFKHDPAEVTERKRIREAGGYVSKHGKLNDHLDVSRAFGYIQFMPCVNAAPYVTTLGLTDQDEMILIASRELWEYVDPDMIKDVAREQRGDLMRAAQKIRDIAIAYGATSKIMIMLMGVGDLKKKERNRYRAQSISMGPNAILDDDFFREKNRKRVRDRPDDSSLARLDQEVEAPTGEVSLVFTDIKNSTLLWETYPIAMRSAINLHNNIMRRQLRIIGGYEVKTEGDAFMVCFPTSTSALRWCFSVQQLLLEAPWPQEVLSSVHGEEVADEDGNVIYRGLSVRMGTHWGAPVWEPDPVTRRMDYFGPIVNRAARISAVADGGQITVSADFLADIRKCLETFSDSDRLDSAGSEEQFADERLATSIRRDLRSLGSGGFEVKELGEKKLKGLENPEFVYLMYPHSLAGRLASRRDNITEATQTMSGNGQPREGGIGDDEAKLRTDSLLASQLNTDAIMNLWKVGLRLEALCSMLETDPTKNAVVLNKTDTLLVERMQTRGGEFTDTFVVSFVEQLITRIEVSGHLHII